MTRHPPNSPLFPSTPLSRSGIRIDEGAAAGRQHLRAALQQARDHARLASAEFRLATDRENIGDGHARGLLDLRIGIHEGDRKSTRLNSSHSQISYAVFCLKK